MNLLKEMFLEVTLGGFLFPIFQFFVALGIM